MEKKKRLTAHEGIMRCLKSSFLSDLEIELIIGLYADRDIICPPKAIPDVIVALEDRLKISLALKNMIRDAIANLRVQLAEHEAEMAVSGVVVEKPVPESEKNFRNPQKPWEHVGKFSLEIVPDVPDDILKTFVGVSSFKRKADKIILTFRSETGKISLSPSGIVLDVGEGNRHWHYRNVKAIRDGEGNILWRNDKRKKLPRPQVSQRRVHRSQNLD